MIVMETACLQTVEIYYCGGYDYVLNLHAAARAILLEDG
jgi:hypothetical protein